MKDNEYLDSDGYFFEADGHRYRIGDEEDVHLFQTMIDNSGLGVGEEVYLINYREGLNGCYDIGWMAVFNVEELFSKVFMDGKESILDAVGRDTKGAGIIQQFLKLLDENNIKYGQDWIRID